MAAATAQPHCSQCNEEKDLYECKGCSQTFCFDHLTDHRERINQQFNQLEDQSNLVRETIIHQKNHLDKHPLIQQIDHWENESIQRIQQTAKQCRERLIKYTKKFLIETENQLNDLTEQMKQIRQKKKFNEIDSNQLNQKLTKLEAELHHLSNLSIEQQSTSLINNISVLIPIDKETKWKQTGIIIAGGNGDGSQCNQLSCPCGICIDDEQTLLIADFGNDRIMEWQSNGHNGRIVVDGHGQGNQTNKLNRPVDVILDRENHSLIIADFRNRRVLQWPYQNPAKLEQILLSDIDCRGLTMDMKGSLYVSDWKKNEVRRWKRGETKGTVVAGGNGKGDGPHQLDYPTSTFVDADESLYVSDAGNHRVMKWQKDAEEGTVVAGGNGPGQSLRQLYTPMKVIVDPFGHIYVVDFGNTRVMRWCEGVKEGTIVVGGNGQGQQSNQLYCPMSLSFDRQGNLYVADRNNHRIQKFEVD